MKFKLTKKLSFSNILSLIVLAGFVFIATLLLKSDKKDVLVSKLWSRLTIPSTLADAPAAEGGVVESSSVGGGESGSSGCESGSSSCG